MKVDETSKIKERTCTKSCAQYKSTNTGYSRLISGLVVFFSRFVFSFELYSSFHFSGAMIVRIDGVCIGLGESYGL